MKKEIAGERKRTVTITIGPATEAFLERYRAEVAKNNQGLDVGITACAGACLHAGLCDWLRAHEIEKPKGYASTHE